MKKVFEVISYDTKYYCTDGVIEDVIKVFDNKEAAERFLACLKMKATPCPYTGFKIKTRYEEDGDFDGDCRLQEQEKYLLSYWLGE